MPIELDDICIQKLSIIERSIRRYLEEYKTDPNLDNYSHQDSFVLNVQRSSQAIIDLALHIVSGKHLGMPNTSSDAFEILFTHNIISESSKKSMISMVGFRNLAIHEYQKIEKDVLFWIARVGFQSQILSCNELGFNIII